MKNYSWAFIFEEGCVNPTTHSLGSTSKPGNEPMGRSMRLYAALRFHITIPMIETATGIAPEGRMGISGYVGPSSTGG